MRILPAEYYYGLIVLFLAVDILVYLKIRVKKHDKVKYARLGFISSFLYLAVVISIATNLSAAVVWLPAILAAGVLWYVSFIKYPPQKS